MSVFTLKGENQRRRILDSATSLFARKGFAATGMREIANEAGVNLAMINYYFGSKSGLLKNIMENFFDSFEALIVSHFDNKSATSDFENSIRAYSRDLTLLCREKTDLMKVCITEFPADIPEIADFKNMRMKNILNAFIRNGISSDSAQKSDGGGYLPFIKSSALGGMIFMHFLFKPVIETFLNTRLGNDFYDSFSDQVSNLFLFGALGNSTTGNAVKG